MPRRIDGLTVGQLKEMTPFVRDRIARGWRTSPLSFQDWGTWRDGVERCYRFAGLAPPRRVVTIDNPVVGALAAPEAARTLAGHQDVDLAADAVDDVLLAAVGDPVVDAVKRSVRSEVHRAVKVVVGDAVEGAVDGAIDGPVHERVRQWVGTLHDGGQPLNRLWHRRFGGVHWAGWWHSYVAYLRDVAGLRLDRDHQDRFRAFEDAMSAGWWWPFRSFVMVCDVPKILRVEQYQPLGRASHRLHCADGPSIAWPGFELYYWHGVHVPDDFFGWGVERALEEPDVHVRRCALERLGHPASASLRQSSR